MTYIYMSLIFGVLACFTCSRANVLACSRAFYVLACSFACSRAFYVLACSFACSRAFYVLACSLSRIPQIPINSKKLLSHHYLSIRSILGRGCILEIIKTQFYSVNCACTYHNARVQLKFFLEKDCPESELNSWLSWWHDRRELIFLAFTSKTAPSINLAEVIHAGWKNRDRMGVSLLDACFFDVRDKLLFESLIDGMFNGSFVVGCGPSQGELSKIR